MRNKLIALLLGCVLLFSGVYVYGEWANPSPQAGGDNAGQLLLKHESNMTDIYQSNTGKLNLLKKNFSGTTSPSSSDEGQAWWDSTNNTFNLYDGSAFGQVFPLKATTATSANTYSVTLTPAIASYIANTDYHVTFASTNTSTTPTLNINSLGAKTITKEGNTALANGDITDNHAAILRYNGTNLVLMNTTGAAAKFFRAYKNAAQTISTTTWTKVVLNLETFDANNVFDSVTNSRLVIPNGETWAVFGRVLMETAGTFGRGVAIYKNGVAYDHVMTDTVVGSGAAPYAIQVSGIYTGNGTDYYELYTYHNQGTNIDIAATFSQTVFYGFKL